MGYSYYIRPDFPLQRGEKGDILSFAMKQNSNENRMGIFMAVAAFFWGTTFVAQRMAAQHIPSFTWVAARALASALLLIPCIAFMRKKGFSQKTAEPKNLWVGGICCGVVLFFSTSAQQWGLTFTSAGKAGFITALYIVLVPIIRMLLGKRVPLGIWVSVALATVGLYLLSVTEAFTIGIGDLLLLACALFFSFHILVVDHFSPKVEALALCQVQFLVSGILAAIAALLTETPTVEGLVAGFWPTLYAALFSGCIAYSAQIIGQRHMEPTRASLIMCLESVFSLLAGWIILGERFTLREGLGTLLMFIAIVSSTLLTRERAQEVPEEA